jgi:alpha-mannosidase
MTARLAAGSARLEIELFVQNRAKDHRLRALFDAPDAAPPVRAEGLFDAVRRPAGAIGWGEGWVESPSPTHHQAGFVAAGSLALFAPGLPEYEAFERPEGGITIALTLLRCVGRLAREGLVMRRESAGPGIPTPDAQCLGRHAFRLALGFDAADTTDVDLVVASADVRTPFVLGPAGADPGLLLGTLAAVPAFAALKRAENGDGAILRLSATGTTGAPLDLGTGRCLEVCRLDETPTGEDVPRELVPGGLVTLRIR